MKIEFCVEHSKNYKDEIAPWYFTRIDGIEIRCSGSTLRSWGEETFHKIIAANRKRFDGERTLEVVEIK